MSEMESSRRPPGALVCQDTARVRPCAGLLEADTTDWMARCPTLAYAGGSKGLLGLFSRRVSNLKDTEWTTQTD